VDDARLAIGLGAGTQALTLLAVVSSTTVQAGENGMPRIAMMMHEGMGGPHDFRITVKTNDAVSPETVLTVKAVFGP
jgi:predicted RNA methylase